MKLILLGTGTTLPQKNRNAAGLLIHILDEYLLFDCGNGILRQIEQINVDFTRIRDIFISHLHADHVNDLPVLLKANIMRKISHQIRIYGPSTIMKSLEGWFKEVYPYLDKVLEIMKVEEIKTEWIERENWKIQAFPVQHGIEAYGFKLIAEGKTIVYSGDTGYCEELIQMAQNADLLIHECSYPTEYGHGKGHTTPLEVGQIAQDANVKQVILTHFYPVCNGRENEMLEDVKKRYNGEVIFGKDLQVFNLE
ncbi:MAG: MBL fold metallo-hydrolase [Candidatus Helarchaeota archaeon]